MSYGLGRIRSGFSPISRACASRELGEGKMSSRFGKARAAASHVDLWILGDAQSSEASTFHLAKRRKRPIIQTGLPRLCTKGEQHELTARNVGFARE